MHTKIMIRALIESKMRFSVLAETMPNFCGLAALALVVISLASPLHDAFAVDELGEEVAADDQYYGNQGVKDAQRRALGEELVFEREIVDEDFQCRADLGGGGRFERSP